MINLQPTEKKRLSKILDMYRADDKLIRFSNAVRRKVIFEDQVDIDELVAQDTFEAYWCDLGGEGA